MKEMITKLKSMRKFYLDYKLNLYLLVEIKYRHLEITMHEINDIESPLCKIYKNGTISNFSIVISGEEIVNCFNDNENHIYWERVTELNNGIKPDTLDDFDNCPECDYSKRKLENMAWKLVFDEVMERIKNSAISLLELKGRKPEDVNSMALCDCDGEICFIYLA